MKSHGLRGLAASGSLLLLIACSYHRNAERGIGPVSTPGGGATATSSLACGQPSPLVDLPGDPTMNVARAGPVAFRDFHRDEQVAAIADYVPGYPTKVLILPFTSLRAAVTLQGWRCADGQPLRFWYEGGVPLTSLPASEATMTRTGDLLATLPPQLTPSMGGRMSYPGYMLFTSPGTWKVVVRQDGKLLGSVVFLVPEQGPSRS